MANDTLCHNKDSYYGITKFFRAGWRGTVLFPNNFIFHSYETLYSSRKVLQFADYIYDYVSDDGAVYPVLCAGMEEKLPAFGTQQVCKGKL